VRSGVTAKNPWLIGIVPPVNGTLPCPSEWCNLPAMSAREIAIDLIQRLPEEASLQDIAREIEFIAGVREGFSQIERGEGKSAEEVRGMISSWTTK
jgi:hypothetical protein